MTNKFLNAETFRNIKRSSTVYLCCWKKFPSSPRHIYLSFWSNKIFSLKSFFWTSKMQCWEVCWKIFARKSLFFCSMDKTEWKLFFNWNSHFLELLFWTQKMKFWQPFGKISTKCREVFDQDPKLKKKQFRREYIFICSFGHVECNFETFGENRSQKKRKVYAEYLNKFLIFVFFSEEKELKLLFLRRRTHFWQPAEKNSKNGQNCLLNRQKRLKRLYFLKQKLPQNVLLDT